jgi:cytochrome c-type biogenesis protein CcmH
MVLHLIFAAMLVVAMLAVLVPLARGSATAGAGQAAGAGGATPVELHRLRLAEIARDLDRGLLDPAGAAAARNEAARLLLRMARQEEGPAPLGTAADQARAALRRHRVVALVALIGLPAIVLPLYVRLGSPSLPGRPFVAAGPVNPASADLATLIGQVEAHLVEHPDDGKGFEVVAPIYMRLARYEDALRARSEALRLLGETPDRLADLAEARMAAAGGMATRDASEAVGKALAIDPKHAKARFLQALVLEQDGRRDEAVAALKAMLVDAPAGAPWRAAVEARLERLAPSGASQASAIAALPAEAQNDAIRSMVEGLAARLKQQGGSAEEWARLVRSYAVLGDADKARAALAEASAAMQDEGSRAKLLETARAAGIEEKAQ